MFEATLRFNAIVDLLFWHKTGLEKLSWVMS